MISYPVLLINKKLYRAKTFSKILIHLSKEKLEIIKLNNLDKKLVTTLVVEANFSKSLFPIQKKKKKVSIIIGFCLFELKFYPKQTIFNF